MTRPHGPRPSTSSTRPDVGIPAGPHGPPYIGRVPLILLLPAGAAVVALAALTLVTGRLELELAELRRSLRRAGATAVATDELSRAGARVAAKAAATGEEAKSRLRRPRLVRSSHPR